MVSSMVDVYPLAYHTLADWVRAGLEAEEMEGTLEDLLRLGVWLRKHLHHAGAQGILPSFATYPLA